MDPWDEADPWDKVAAEAANAPDPWDQIADEEDPMKQKVSLADYHQSVQKPEQSLGTATSISAGDTGWVGTGKQWLKDTLMKRPEGAAKYVPVYAGAKSLINLIGNVSKVGENVLRDVAQGKSVGPEILETQEAGRPSTFDPERDRRIDYTANLLGIIASLGGLGPIAAGAKAKQLETAAMRSIADELIKAPQKAAGKVTEIVKEEQKIPILTFRKDGKVYTVYKRKTVDRPVEIQVEQQKLLPPAPEVTEVGIPGAEKSIKVTQARPTFVPKEQPKQLTAGAIEMLPPKAGQTVVAPARKEIIRQRTGRFGKAFTSQPEVGAGEKAVELSRSPEALLEAARNSQLGEVVEKQADLSGLRQHLVNMAKQRKQMLARKAKPTKFEDVWEARFESTPEAAESTGPGVARLRTKELPTFTGEPDLAERAAAHNLRIQSISDNAREVIRQAELAKEAEKLPNPEDAKQIANLASRPDSDKAKISKRFAYWVRSLDNWLMENGGRTVVEPIRQAVRAGDRWKHEYFTKLDDILNGGPVKVREGSKQAELIGRYLNGEKVEGFTPELQQVADRLRAEIFEPIIQQIKSDPELKGIIGEVGYIKDYFPQIEKVWKSRYGEENALALVHDLKPARFKAPFFKKRVKEAKDPMLDIVSVMRMYLRGSSKTLFDIKGYKAAEDALKKLPAGPQNLFKELASDYAKSFIGQPSTLKHPTATTEAFQKIHDWYYKAYIGLNPVSAAVNLSQTANTFVSVGTKHTLRAINDVFKGNRAMDKLFMDTGVLSEFPGMEISSQLQGRVSSALFFLFRRAEALNRKIAFNAGFYEASGGKAASQLSQLELEKAINHALDVVHDTQFTYGKVSPVHFAQQPLVGQFSNYPLKEMEFLLRSLKTPEQRRRAIAMMTIAGAVGVSEGKDMFEGVRDIVPGPGPAFQDLANVLATLSGYKRKPTAKEVLFGIARRTPGVGGIVGSARWVSRHLKED